MSPKAYPFHSIIPQEEQIQTLADLESGLVRIIVATTAGQVGLDMAVCDVIILDLPSDFEAITQWNGCAGWDGQGVMQLYMLLMRFILRTLWTLMVTL